MNWKLILTTSLIAGIISMPLQVYGIYLSVMSNYGNIGSNLIILLVLGLIWAVGIFSFIYSQIESNHFAQALITVILSFALGFAISLIGVKVFLETS